MSDHEHCTVSEHLADSRLYHRVHLTVYRRRRLIQHHDLDHHIVITSHVVKVRMARRGLNLQGKGLDLRGRGQGRGRDRGYRCQGC